MLLLTAKENVTVEESTLEELLSIAQGDMRKAVMLLQSCHQLVGQGGVITPQTVVDISGKVI